MPQLAPSCCYCRRFSLSFARVIRLHSKVFRLHTEALWEIFSFLFKLAHVARSTAYIASISCALFLPALNSFTLLNTVMVTHTYTFLHSYTWIARCRNPNAKVGYCVSIYECPSLLEVVQRYNLAATDRVFLQKSQCVNGYGRSPHVCCTPDKGYVSPNDNQNPTTVDTTITTTTTRRPTTVYPPSPSNGGGNVLPVPPECGPTSLDDKIYNGKDTALDQYPWMVLLEYTQSKCTCIICVFITGGGRGKGGGDN